MLKNNSEVWLHVKNIVTLVEMQFASLTLFSDNNIVKIRNKKVLKNLGHDRVKHTN